MRLVPVAAAIAAVGVLLAGCSSAPSNAPIAAPTAPAEATAPTAAAEFLARHNLTGLTTRQLIDSLDASEDDRAAGPVGSVRPDELQLSDGTGRVTLPVPADTFYLSIAPYVTKTHDCFNHNLATCKGELANQVIHVTITDAAGTTLLDKDLTTYANGFAGLWLPRNMRGTLTVTAVGKTASTPIATGPGDPTCLTTLKLQEPA